MGSAAVVTDSTHSLSRELVAGHGIVQVNLVVLDIHAPLLDAGRGVVSPQLSAGVSGTADSAPVGALTAARRGPA